MNHVVSAFSMLLVVFGLALVGCGTTAKDRAQYVSPCAPLQSPIALGADPSLQEIVLSDVRFDIEPETDMAKKPHPHQMALFPIKIEGKAQTDLVGALLMTGSGAGINRDYPYAPEAAPTTDEEGLTYRFLPSRKLGGKRTEKDGVVTFVSRMIERSVIWDEKKKEVSDGQKNLVTSLIVGLEGGRLRSLEINWPISKSDNWRKGPFLLPALQLWMEKNERLCLKSATRR